MHNEQSEKEITKTIPLTIAPERIKCQSSVQFSRSVISNSLWPHGLQHARFPSPSPTSGACWNSCPLSWWCPPTISSPIAPLLLLPLIFPRIRVFSNNVILKLSQDWELLFLHVYNFIFYVYAFGLYIILRWSLMWKPTSFFPNDYSVIPIPFNKYELSKLTSKKREIPAPTN